MTLPYPDPSNPALPSPLFSDVTAVRADHMRANNAAIFADLEAFNTRNPAPVALTGGSFKTSALANANTYNGRSLFTCTAGVSDTPYAGVWRISGTWNPTDSSGRFIAMLDTSLETWEINYSGAAWGTWTKRVEGAASSVANNLPKFSDTSGKVISDSGVSISTDATMASNSDLKVSTEKAVKTNLNNNDTYLNSQGASAAAFKRQKTLNTKYGFWGDVVWKDATNIIIKPKAINGLKWVGCILSDGKYLESATSITVTLGTNTLDGLAQVQANSWYILYGYEISATGLLGFNLGWAPSSLCQTSSSTTLIKLPQINSKNINKLFPVGAGLVVWHDGTHFETPIYKYGVGYTPDGALSFVGSYAGANDIVPLGTLGITPVNTDPVYQVGNFQPLDTTGVIATVIGSKGWMDTGIRMYSNASSQIQPFSISSKNDFLFSNGDLSANIQVTPLGNLGAPAGVLRSLWVPPDKNPIGYGTANGTNGSLVDYDYWATYGQTLMGGMASWTMALKIKGNHGLIKMTCVAGNVSIGFMGYEI